MCHGSGCGTRCRAAPPKHLDAVTKPGDNRASWGRFKSRRRGTDAVVLNRHDDVCVGQLERDVHFARLRVLRHMARAFLHDPNSAIDRPG